MSKILISDPFLFPPSGEDPSREYGYGYSGLKEEEEDSRLDADQFYNYSRKEFERDWEKIFSGEAEIGSYLFDFKEDTDLNTYLPDTPESIEMDEYNYDLSVAPEYYQLSSPFKADEHVPPAGIDNSLSSDLCENSEPLEDNGNGSTWEEKFISDLVGADDDQLMKAICDGSPKTDQVEYETVGQHDASHDTSLYGHPSLVTPTHVNPFLVNKDPPLASVSVFAPVSAPASLVKVEKPKSSRKASHQPIQFSPPTYEDNYAEDVNIKIETMVENLPALEKSRRRKHSGSTDNMSCQSEISPSSKRPKLYEIDSPRAKNAKAAKANREKKKNELYTMKIECEKLQRELQTSQKEKHAMELKAMQMEKELAIQKKISESLSGLARVSSSAKSLLQSMITGFARDFDQKYKVEVPEWFHQAPANPSELVGTDKFLTQGETSSFITFHVSQHLQTVRIDYSPEEPIVSNSIPGVPQ